MWHVENATSPADLEKVLNKLHQTGWSIKYVLTEGGLLDYIFIPLWPFTKIEQQ